MSKKPPDSGGPSKPSAWGTPDNPRPPSSARPPASASSSGTPPASSSSSSGGGIIAALSAASQVTQTVPAAPVTPSAHCTTTTRSYPSAASSSSSPRPAAASSSPPPVVASSSSGSSAAADSDYGGGAAAAAASPSAPRLTYTSPARGSKRAEIMRIVDRQILKQLPAIKKLDPNAIVGYRGSLARGQKGPHKGNAPFDPRDFDVDAFIVSDTLAARFRDNQEFRDGGRISEVRKTQGKIDSDLRRDRDAGEAREEMQGLRQQPFTFRIFTREEYRSTVQTDDYKTL